MSKASVKKALKELDHEGLVNLLMDLYACRKDAKDFLEFWADPDEDKELDRIKERIHKLFFLPHDKPRRKPDMTEIKTLVKNFRTLGPDPEKIADLLIYVPEQMFEWLQRRNGTGMTAARSKFDAMLLESQTFIESAGLEQMFGMRHNRIAELIYAYYNAFPDEKESHRYRKWFRFHH